MNGSSQSSWEEALSNLNNSASKLINSLSTLDDEILNKNVAGKNFTYYFLLYGLIQHDIYHAG